MQSDLSLNHLKFSIIFKSFCFSFLCRCAVAAEKNRYGLFGITDEVKCWGFNGNKGNLMRLKKSSHCIHASKTGATCKETDTVCAGTSNDQETESYQASFIYSAFGKNMFVFKCHYLHLSKFHFNLMVI